MLDLHELQLECEHILKLGEVEGRIHAAVAQKRDAVAQTRGDLEAQLAKAAEALRQQQQEVARVHTQAAADRSGMDKLGAERGVAGVWPELERAAAAVKAIDERIAEARRQVFQHAESERQRVDEFSSLYQLYCAATGLRWHPSAEGLEGYVAKDSMARAFDIPLEKADEAVVTADALWEEIEACLPEQLHPASSNAEHSRVC